MATKPLCKCWPGRSEAGLAKSISSEILRTRERGSEHRWRTATSTTSSWSCSEPPAPLSERCFISPWTTSPSPRGGAMLSRLSLLSSLIWCNVVCICCLRRHDNVTLTLLNNFGTKTIQLYHYFWKNILSVMVYGYFVYFCRRSFCFLADKKEKNTMW